MAHAGNWSYPYACRPAMMEGFTRDLKEAHLMFDHHCTACDKRQLIFPRQVTSLVNTDHGIIVALTCWCGADQTLLTGRSADRRETVAA